MKNFTILLLTLCLCSCQAGRIYVSPDGDDCARGTRSKPLNTLDAAVSKAALSGRCKEIVLLQGVYGLQKPVIIDSLSGLMISAAKGAEVVISGARTISPDAASAVTDSIILGRLKPDVRGKALEIDISGIEGEGIFSLGFGRNTSRVWTELYVNGRSMELSRWPDDGEVPTDTVYCRGRKVRNKPVSELPVIGFIQEEPCRWQGSEGIWIWGYFGNGYADDLIPVASIDSASRKMTMGDGTPYGFSLRSEMSCARWCAKNVLEEMNLPGEYVLDIENHKIYFLPPEEGVKSLEVTSIGEAMVQIRDCSGVTLKNLIIQGGRADGVLVTGGDNCVLDGCTLRNLGHLAVHIGEGTRCSGLMNCTIYNTGSGAVELIGGDRLALENGNNFVEFSTIHDVNRYGHADPAITIKGCGNRVSHCEIFNITSRAVLMRGNEHLIEYCDIHDACTQMSDNGVIYYGRNPSERGLKVRYCNIHDCHSVHDEQVFGIYHDDGACGMDVYGCIFDNVGTSAVDIGGGQDISYHNCLFMKLERGFQIDDRYGEPGKSFKLQKSKLEAVNYRQAPYSGRYPELVNYLEDNPGAPKRLKIDDNLFYEVKKAFDPYVIHTIGFDEYFGDNNISTDDKSIFKNGENVSSGLDIGTVRKYVGNFTDIPVDKIGNRR